MDISDLEFQNGKLAKVETARPDNMDGYALIRAVKGIAELLVLKPIETCPKNGTYFLAWGPSGYTTTPLRCEVCRWDEDHRPLSPIQTHSNDPFTDGGAPATHWSPLLVMP